INRLEKQRLADAFRNPTTSEWSYKAGTSNRQRNRYSDVLPFDKNRVKLKVKSSDYSDYMNASSIHLDLGSTPGNYISTQGPTSKTYKQFWQMCFQNTQKQIIIVMLTPIFESGREKCYKYWTENDFVVNNADEGFSSELLFKFKGKLSINNNFQVLEWELGDASTGSTRQVLHFYYDNWPDFSAPDLIDPVLELTKSVNEFHENALEDPIIVHCSAGVGRSGTFISIDYFLNHCLEFLESNEKETLSAGRSELITPVNNHEIDDPVFNIVSALRTQRVLMVQKDQQFLFIYECIKRYY
ncbi:hypothetical protein CANARDRAFT_182013, partial [[Candida] arabinofermentans NRRL YB-2248]